MKHKKLVDGNSTHHHENPPALREGTFLGIATQTATNAGAITELLIGQETQLILESKEKFPYKLASISDAKGDIRKRWHVKFHVWNKLSGKLERKRIFISNRIKTKAGRYREADKIIREINRLLQTGYVIGKKAEPQHKPAQYQTFLQAFRWVQKSRQGEIRNRSIQTFDTIIKNLEEYVKLKNLSDFPVTMVTREMCEDLMTWIKKERGITNNTYNNYLGFLKGYFNYLVQKDKLRVNPAHNIKTLPKTDSINSSFPKPVRQELMEAYVRQYPGLAIFAQYIFYSFIRPAELRLLKVNNLLADTIFIPGHVSKNRKSEHVLISPGLAKLIDDLGVRNFPPSWYLIGKNGKPSDEMLPINYFNRRHIEIRRQLGLDEMYKLYCWKHTGVVEMYQATKDLEFVSRHCRHSSLDMTKNYLRGLGLMIDYRIMDQLPVLKI